MAENIRFIRSIVEPLERMHYEVGNCIYIPLGKANRAKLWCDSGSVQVEIINAVNGRVDSASLPFTNYFTKKRCGLNCPYWSQSIRNGKWNFEDEYPHVVPSYHDLCAIADAVDAYCCLFRDEGGMLDCIPENSK